MVEKNKDSVYDDLAKQSSNKAVKKTEWVNSHVKYQVGTVPNVWKVVTSTDHIPQPDDFIKDEIACPICKKKHGIDVYVKHPGETKWVNKCSKCKTLINFFTPQPLQRLIQDIQAPIVNVISGYGLGKTTIDMQMVADVAYNLDGAEILVAASTLTSLNTGKDELKKFIYKPDIVGRGGDFIVMNKELWQFKNGSKVRWMTANSIDATTIRSWNFNFAVLLEASSEIFFKGGSESFYSELKMRLRNKSSDIEARDSKDKRIVIVDKAGRPGAIEYEASMHRVVLESNPAATTIMDEVLKKSSVLIITENVANADKQAEDFVKNYSSINSDSGIVSVLASSRDNRVLSESYFTSKFAGQPEYYVARMRDCDLTRHEHQVFQSALDYREPALPADLLRTADKIVMAFDPGSVDPSGIVYTAIWKDWEGTGFPKMFTFAAKLTEGGATRKGNSFAELAAIFNNIETRFGLAKFSSASGKVVQGWTNPATGKDQRVYRIADLQLWERSRAKSVAEEQYEETEFDRWEKIGFTFNKASKGSGSIERGIATVEEFFENSIWTWDESLEDLREEFIRYWYEEKNGVLKPMEKAWNHLMDGLRYTAFFAKDYFNGELPNTPVLLRPSQEKYNQINLFGVDIKPKTPQSRFNKTRTLKR